MSAAFVIAVIADPLAAVSTPLPNVAMPATFETIPTSAPAAPHQDRWWESFGDPALNRLVERVLADNTTIAEAAAKLGAARADAHLTAAESAPKLGVEGGASEAGGPLINAAGSRGSLFTARAALSWEIDLTGRLSDSKAAARLDAAAAEAMLRHARLLIVAETVDGYWRAQFLEARAALDTEQADILQRQLARANERRAHGLAAVAQIAAASSELSRAQADLVETERQHNLAIHQLQFLSGSTEPMAVSPVTPSSPPTIPAGLPSELLARRPDVAAADAEFRAADKRFAAARKSWLPSFSLTASGGAASPSLGQIVATSAQSFGLNLLFGLPLFDGGRHKALVGRRKAEVELAAARYSERILGALREVNDALANVSASREVFRLATEDAASAQALLAAATAAQQHGIQSLAEVESRKVAAITSRQAVLASNFERYEAALEVIQSLGGSW